MVWFHNPNGNESSSVKAGSSGVKDSGVEYWPAFEAVQKIDMVMAVPSRVEQDYFEGRCEFWDQVDASNRIQQHKPRASRATKPRHTARSGAKPKQATVALE